MSLTDHPPHHVVPLQLSIPADLALLIDGIIEFQPVDATDATLIVVHGAQELEAASSIMSCVRRSAAPVISLAALPGADAAVSAPELATALTRLAPIATRVADLAPEVLGQDDPALGLLAYLAVREGRLEPWADPGRPSVVDYRERERFPGFDDLIAALCSAGQLQAEFRERLNLCHGCHSARLLVRDQCPVCASSRLCDHAILHHFRCACQAPERDFRLEDGGLRCPKCRQGLYQIGFDYEASSGYCQCLSCNEMTIQPQLGFRCLDCELHGKAEDLAERDIHAYTLTEAGYATLGMQLPVERN